MYKAVGTVIHVGRRFFPFSRIDLSAQSPVERPLFLQLIRGSVRKMRIYNVKLFFGYKNPASSTLSRRSRVGAIISLTRITRWIPHVHVIYIFQGKQYSPQHLHDAGNLGLKRVAVFLWQCVSIDVDVCDTKIRPNCKYLYPL